MDTAIYEACYLDGIDPGVGDLFFGDPVIGSKSDEGQPLPAPSGTDHGATWTDITPGQETPSGWPAAVKVRPDNWDLSLQPARYTIASGDTLSGLASTYSGNPQNWRDIYDLNKPSPISNPDVIFPGQIIAMPDYMRDNLIAWIKLGQPTAAKPGELSKADKASVTGTAGFLKRHKVPLIIGGVGAAGAAAYFLTR